MLATKYAYFCQPTIDLLQKQLLQDGGIRVKGNEFSNAFNLVPTSVRSPKAICLTDSMAAT
jgi:hypothetical protein